MPGSIFKSSALGNLIFLLFPFALVILVIGVVILIPIFKAPAPIRRVYFYEIGIALGALVALAGWIRLFKSKWPQIRAGQWATIGPAGLTVKQQRAYRKSYIQLGAGIAWIIALTLLLVFK